MSEQDAKQNKKLKRAERAIYEAFSTGKADRAMITRMAQLEAAEAVARAGEAMEADEEADEAMRITLIAERSGNRERAKKARAREREARKTANGLHRAATKSAKQAYDAIKFSAPNKMGFMRAVQVIFAFHIASLLVFLLLTSRDAFSYDVSSIMDWIMVILEGIAFWMFINRYKVARPFVMGMAGIGLVVPAAVDVVSGTFTPGKLVSDGLFYIFLLLYFVFSKRAQASLVNDLSKHKGVYDDEEFVIERRGWPFVRNLIMYFILFSILGHWMEMAMCQLIIAGLVEGEYDPTNTMLWRDWLYPFPMEGAAVVIIALLLYPLLGWLKKKFENKIVPYVISFFANALTCSIIEFSMGLIVNGNYQLWDYRDMPFNLMGQVCLQNAAAFGVAASIIAWFVYPMLERWIARAPRDIMNIVFVGVLIFGGIIWSLYIVDPSQNLQNAATERLQANEQNSYAHDLSLGQASVNDLRKGIEESTTLTDEQKAQALKDLDAMDANMDSLSQTLGVESAA